MQNPTCKHFCNKWFIFRLYQLHTSYILVHLGRLNFHIIGASSLSLSLFPQAGTALKTFCSWCFLTSVHLLSAGLISVEVHILNNVYMYVFMYKLRALWKILSFLLKKKTGWKLCKAIHFERRTTAKHLNFL